MKVHCAFVKGGTRSVVLICGNMRTSMTSKLETKKSRVVSSLTFPSLWWALVHDPPHSSCNTWYLSPRRTGYLRRYFLASVLCRNNPKKADLFSSSLVRCNHRVSRWFPIPFSSQLNVNLSLLHREQGFLRWVRIFLQTNTGVLLPREMQYSIIGNIYERKVRQFFIRKTGEETTHKNFQTESKYKK